MKNTHTGFVRWLISVCILLFFISIGFLYCDYPEIKTLSTDDPLYKQLQNDISAYYKALYSNGAINPPVLKIFQYTLSLESDLDLLGVASRLNIPYDTISSLNHINNLFELKKNQIILLSNIPGVFVTEKPQTDLEQLMLSWRMQSEDVSQQIVINKNGEKERYLFFPGKRFHPVERAYFLNCMFRFPLPRGNITSSFGIRQNPFSGHPEVHNGIDIGAPEGTEVYAAREGIVKNTGFDKTYGNFVLIIHSGGYQSFYGHLKEIFVNLNMKVFSGMVIGKVGITGRSTGPHLHFEIRKNGSPLDPVPYFQRIEK